MRICQMSDLHMEVGGYPGRSSALTREGGGDVLILGGDITCARFFQKGADPKLSPSIRKAWRNMNLLLDNYGKHFSHILYIMGNHEHYGAVLDQSAETMRAWIEPRFPKVTVLDRDHKIIDDVLFVGATLWTDFNRGDPFDMLRARDFMNDYATIHRVPPEEVTWVERQERNRHAGLITPEYILERHYADLAYIKDVLSSHPTMKTVVLTHHAPSTKSQSRHRGQMMEGAYVSNLESLILDNPQIALWSHGHTHDDMDYPIGNTRIRAHHRGYAGYEYCAHVFRPSNGMVVV